MSLSMQCVPRLQQNLEQRTRLLQKLEYKSEMFENCMVRTEKLLKSLRYQRPLILLKEIAELRFKRGVGYRAIIDMLVGLFSPPWDELVQTYYRESDEGGGKQLIAVADWDLITKMDLALCELLEQLKKLYEYYECRVWDHNRPKVVLAVEKSIPRFATTRFPELASPPSFT